MFVAITGITSTDVKLISALVTACIVIYFKFKTQEMKLKHTEKRQDKQIHREQNQLKRDELKAAEKELNLKERELRIKEHDLQLREREQKLYKEPNSNTKVVMQPESTNTINEHQKVKSEEIDGSDVLTGSTEGASQITKMKDF